MKPKWMAGLLLIALLTTLAVRQYMATPDVETPPMVVVDLSCPAPAAGCTAQVGNQTISLGFAGEVRPLKPFQVWVKAHGVDKVQASFTMMGMNMGFNRYTLRPDKTGVFLAQVTLPACVSGRRDWVMALDVDHEFRVSVPFTTEGP